MRSVSSGRGGGDQAGGVYVENELNELGGIERRDLKLERLRMIKDIKGEFRFYFVCIYSMFSNIR